MKTLNLRALKGLALFGAFHFLLLFSPFVFADDDNLDDRNRLANKRNERFFKPNITRHFISLTGEYDSDENSKQHILKFDHFFKNRKWISDIELRMETLYENVSQSYATSGKQHLEKESDQYRAIIAEKIVLGDSPNYFILFNETRYDDEANYSYYDITTAAGFGRMFFNDQLELDLGYGFTRGKEITDTTRESSRQDYDRRILVPSFRTEFQIFEKIRVIQRGYAYYSSGAIDSYYMTTKVQYPVGKRIYLQLQHLFDKRSYDLYDDRTGDFRGHRNEVRRQILLGFRYDFGVTN